MSNKFIKKMKAQCLNMDMISTLPPNIIENILTLMPIKDALRTSILSRKWRYCWTTMPILVFDESLYDASKLCDKLKIYDLVNAVFHVLLSHKGPIEELKIDLAELKMRLELLQLSNCYFEPPITFHGFSGLKSLRFFNVRINPQILKRLLSNCSLLDEVCLSGYEEDIPRDKTFTFVELLSFVPLIVTLQISNDYMKYLATGSIPEKLPTSLVSLKNLFLDVCLMEQDEISSALCMIRSSPNLEGINFRMYNNEKLPVRKTLMDLLDLRDDLSLNLDHLKIFVIENFSNLAIEIKLVKLFMAKSPILENARIELSANVSVNDEVRMLRDLVRCPYPCASPSAKLTIERSEL